MIRLSGSVCIDAPVDMVWSSLARLEDIEIWSHLVRRASCPHGRSRGVGAERTCELAGNIIIEERWIAWDEGRSFA
ncbi:MAG: SRPBCC family protein [Hyphomonadaceae bacterium]|nr:SRPBCC family protein [Hyphomonadaceae bacterium]